MPPVTGKQYNLEPREAAQIYGVTPRTLRRWIKLGYLPAVRVGPRSLRVSAEDMDALARPAGTSSAGDAA